MQITESIPIAPDKNGAREWNFVFNHAALMALEKITGQPAWAVLVQEQETVTRIVNLAWAGSESYRHGTRQTLTLEQFLDGYLPVYLSDEWQEFQDRINALVAKTFPKAAGTRTQLQTLTAAQILSNLANTAQLIGTSASIQPSDGLECPVTSSGTSGTG